MSRTENVSTCYFNNVSSSLNNLSKNKEHVETPVIDSTKQQENLVSSKVSAASRAYGLAQVNKDLKPVSLTDYALKLNSEGKVENKDFKIEKAKDYNNYNLYLFNKDGDPEKIIYWCNGSEKINYTGYDEITYENGKKSRSVSKDENNLIRSVSEFYQKDDKSHELLKELDFSLDTKPENFVKTLENKNIKTEFVKKGDEDNNRWFTVIEKDENGNKLRTTDWYYGTNSFDSNPVFISRSILEEGREVKRIIASQDEFEVVSYQ